MLLLCTCQAVYYGFTNSIQFFLSFPFLCFAFLFFSPLFSFSFVLLFFPSLLSFSFLFYFLFFSFHLFNLISFPSFSSFILFPSFLTYFLLIFYFHSRGWAEGRKYITRRYPGKNCFNRYLAW